MKKTQEPVRSNPFKTKKCIFSSLILILVVSLAAITYFYIYPITNNKIREDRINAIFSSLKLSDQYMLQRESIFGEKVPYDWDKSRSHSSYRTYIRAANVDTTVTELKKSIEAAGFTYFNEPYPGSLQIQYHFKSQKNEYLRLYVSSKRRDDVIENRALMKLPLTDEDLRIDSNTGPSSISIRVNLDDNNE